MHTLHVIGCLMKEATAVDWTKKMVKAIAPGAIAASVGTAALMPLDTISDVQKQWRNTADSPELHTASKSFLQTAKELYHPKIRKDVDGGLKPFYAGMGGKVVKNAPQQALMFAMVPYLQKIMKTTKSLSSQGPGKWSI